MRTKTAKIGFELPSPLTFADGLEYDACLEVDVEYELDEATPLFSIDDVSIVDATVSVCGVDIAVDGKLAEALLRQWLARPENKAVLDNLVERYMPTPEQCDASEVAYRRAATNGRLVLPNGRDVS